MCVIERIRKSKKNIYLTIDDGIYTSVKKLPIEKYEYAKQFNNPDFLDAVSTLTTERDLDDSLDAVAI